MLRRTLTTTRFLAAYIINHRLCICRINNHNHVNHLNRAPMPRPTTLTTTAPLVPNLGAIQALVEGFEKGWEFRQPRSEDSVCASQYVKIREDAPIYRVIDRSATPGHGLQVPVAAEAVACVA